MAVAYYTLERTTVVDAAGTRFDETMFTTSRERLEQAIRAAVERGSGYVEDNLRVAWWATLERRENALAEHSPPWLEVTDRRSLRRALVADARVTRGGQALALRVDHAALAPGRRKAALPFQVGDERFASLEAIGAAAALDPLRRAAGEVDVRFDFTTLFASIPALELPPLENPLRFVPFFKSDDFRELWEDEAADVDLGPVRGDAWDGRLPLDTWLSLEPLHTICLDADVPFKLAP